MEDVKQLRKLAADRDYQAARADEAEKQSAAWQISSGKWKALFESEKQRADVTQESRIAELGKANLQLHIQADADKQKIGEQNFTIRKLKSERKWWFGVGFGTGAVAGIYGAKKFSF